MRMSALARLILAPLVLSASPALGTDRISIPSSVIAAGLSKADCDKGVDQEQDESGYEMDDLGGGLGLVTVSCWWGAYNYGDIFFDVDPAHPDQARLLSFSSFDDKAKPNTVFVLVNAEFTPETKILSEDYKGRGIGDCGTMGDWAWGGSAFALKQFWSKPDCDGELFERDPRWQIFPPRGAN
jgi:hypothetical protein